MIVFALWLASCAICFYCGRQDAKYEQRELAKFDRMLDRLVSLAQSPHD